MIRRTATASVAACMLLGLGALAACGEAEIGRGEPWSSTGVDEVAAHHGQACPKRLVRGGEVDEAEAAPSMPGFDAAWICVYQPTEAGPGPGGDGTSWVWVREGRAREVRAAHLPGLERSLGELVPAKGDRLCTADLGRQLMLVGVKEGDLIGVVVDDFGCHDVRLTDEPFETAPGEARQPGTVPGILQGPRDFTEDLDAAYAG